MDGRCPSPTQDKEVQSQEQHSLVPTHADETISGAHLIPGQQMEKFLQRIIYLEVQGFLVPWAAVNTHPWIICIIPEWDEEGRRFYSAIHKDFPSTAPPDAMITLDMFA